MSRIIDQCSRLNVQVGDTIEGTETWSGGGWNKTRLTLLWLGQEMAVWRETSCNHVYGDWTEPEESASWTLEFRDWRHVGADKP